MLRNAVRGGDVNFLGGKALLDVISVTGGWMGVEYPEKEDYTSFNL